MVWDQEVEDSLEKEESVEVQQRCSCALLKAPSRRIPGFKGDKSSAEAS